MPTPLHKLILICATVLVTISSVQAAGGEVHDCAGDVSCFMKAGMTCRPAVYLREEKNITAQSVITTYLRYEIIGATGGMCDVTVQITDANLTFLPKYRKHLQGTGLTEESIDLVQSQANEMQRETLSHLPRQDIRLEPKLGFIKYFTQLNESSDKAYKVTPHGYLKDARSEGRFILR